MMWHASSPIERRSGAARSASCSGVRGASASLTAFWYACHSSANIVNNAVALSFMLAPPDFRTGSTIHWLNTICTHASRGIQPALRENRRWRIARSPSCLLRAGCPFPRLDTPTPRDRRRDDEVASRAEVTAAFDDLSRAMNLDATRAPRLDGRQIVNDERDLCVAIQHVSVLAREHRTMRANENLATI